MSRDKRLNRTQEVVSSILISSTTFIDHFVRLWIRRSSWSGVGFPVQFARVPPQLYQIPQLRIGRATPRI